MYNRISEAFSVLMGKPRPVERVEIRVPITKGTIYGCQYPTLPMFTTADACLKRYGEATAYTAFESEGSWYAVGKYINLVKLDVRD